MKKRYIILVILLIAIVVFMTNTASAETFVQSSTTDFTKTCTNKTGSICSPTAVCELTIKLPINNSRVVSNTSMTNNDDGIFNYTIAGDNLNTLGKYNWDMFCCDGSDCGEAHGNFLVTKTGVELSQDKAMIYLGMLALLILMFISVCIASIFLPSGNNKDKNEEYFISINNLKYLRPIFYAVAWGLLLAILFTSSNISFLYLETEMMGNLLFASFKVMFAMTLPLFVVGFLFILASAFRDVEMKKLIERGVQIPSRHI